MPHLLRKLPRFFRRPNKGSTTLEYTTLAGCITVAAISSVLVAGDEFTRFFSSSIDHAGQVLRGGQASGSSAQSPSASLSPDYANPCPFEGSAEFFYSGVETRLEPNIWNPAAAPDLARVCVDPGDSSGAPGVGDNWTWEWQVAQSDEIVATPKASFGQSPWRKHSETPSLRSIEGEPVILGYDYDLDVGSGKYAVRATTWLSDREASNSTSISEEVTIWLHSAGIAPPGAPTGDAFTVDGIEYKLWHAARRENIGEGVTANWTAFTFVATSPDASGDLDITAFHDILADAGLIEGPRWLSSVMLGTDVLEGEGDLSLSRLEISGLKGYSGTPPTEPIAAFSFPDTHVPYSAPEFVGSAYLDIEGLGGVPRPFEIRADMGAEAVATSNTMSGKPGAQGEVQWGTALRARPPAPGEETLVALEVDGTIGTWRIIREAPPQARIEPFSFPDTVLAWDDKRKRVASAYVDIPGLEDDPVPFTVGAEPDFKAVARENTDAKQAAAYGELVHGTSLEVNPPEPGRSLVVHLTIGDQTGTWTVHREPAPQIGAFDYGTTMLEHNAKGGWVLSSYVDIPGLGDTARPFTVSTSNGSEAYAYDNVVAGEHAASGELTQGTRLVLALPEKGERVVVTLTVDGVAGEWEVIREQDGSDCVSETGGDCDRGHGNDEDGHDEDNPGNGGGSGNGKGNGKAK